MAGFQEAAATARLVGGKFLHNETGVSPAAVLSHIAGNTLVHFSCHGSAATDSGEAVLVLGDGELSLRDLAISLQSSKAPCFVGLSACESARTEVARAAQAIGFPTLLLSVGTQAVLGTLWPVLDGTARDICLMFYDRWASGMNAGESLDHATRTVRDACIAGERPLVALGTVLAFCLYGDPSIMWPCRQVLH